MATYKQRHGECRCQQYIHSALDDFQLLFGSRISEFFHTDRKGNFYLKQGFGDRDYPERGEWIDKRIDFLSQEQFEKEFHQNPIS